MTTQMYCENCGWPIAPEGVTLTGAAATPSVGAEPARCADVACVALRSVTYRIETRAPGGVWDSHAVGDERANSFSAVDEAQSAIDGLRALGDEWADAEYRVREVA